MATSNVVLAIKTTGQGAVDRLERSLKGLEGSFKKVGDASLKSASRIEGGLKRAGTSVGRLASKVGGLQAAFAGLGGGLALKKAFGDAAELESANTRIQLLTKNYQQFAGIQNVAAESAKKFID